MPRADSEVEWKYLGDLLPGCFCLEMAELTGISGLRYLLHCFVMTLGCFGVVPVLLSAVTASGQLQRKCKERGKRDSLGNTLVTEVMKDVGKVHASPSPILGDAVDGTTPSNSIFLQAWGIE